jgi:hypothetical protein
MARKQNDDLLMEDDLTAAFIMTGGFYYMTSAGSPENAARGLKTIRNAAIGLVISLMSVGIVNLVASGLGK